MIVVNPPIINGVTWWCEWPLKNNFLRAGTIGLVTNQRSAAHLPDGRCSIMIWEITEWRQYSPTFMNIPNNLEDPIKMEDLIQVVGLERSPRVCVPNMCPCNGAGKVQWGTQGHQEGFGCSLAELFQTQSWLPDWLLVMVGELPLPLPILLSWVSKVGGRGWKIPCVLNSGWCRCREVGEA